MKQIIIALFAVAVASAEMDPNCGPFNLPKNVSFVDCCQMKIEMIPNDIITKCAAQFPKPSGPPPPPPAGDGKPPGPPFQACCVAECALKELKIFVDGKIDKNAAITQLSSKDASVKPGSAVCADHTNVCADVCVDVCADGLTENCADGCADLRKPYKCLRNTYESI